MAEFQTYEEMAKNVAEKALDEILYDGKSIREWMQVIGSEDCISRQAVQDYVAKYLSQYLYNDVREAVEVIDEYIGELPPVTPQPKTGHWIYSKAVNTGEIIFSECSVCGNGESRCAKRMNYCPNCGAKMEAEE